MRQQIHRQITDTLNINFTSNMDSQKLNIVTLRNLNVLSKCTVEIIYKDIGLSFCVTHRLYTDKFLGSN